MTDLLNLETMKIIRDQRCLLVEFQRNLWDTILTTNKSGGEVAIKVRFIVHDLGKRGEEVGERSRLGHDLQSIPHTAYAPLEPN